MKTAIILIMAIAAVSALPPAFTKSKQQKNVLTCSTCKLLVKQIDDALTNPENEQAIADELKKICGAIFTENEAAHQQCNNVVDTYLPQLINMLVNEYLSPDEVCLALTACP